MPPDLLPTDEYRQPERGEWHYCEMCECLEMCIYTACCIPGRIYRPLIRKESTMLDLTKPVTTRDGREARVYSQDGAEPWPIHGAIKNNLGWDSVSWTKQGQRLGPAFIGDGDLINPPARFRFERWVNVYGAGPSGGPHPYLYESEIEANRCATSTRIACELIVITGAEGDGL